MANITKVLGRHDWREQKIPQLRESLNEDPNRMKLLCINCRTPWDEQRMGSPPVTGCLTDIKVRNLGTSRMRDYHQQEMRILDQKDRAAAAFEAENDRKLDEYLREQRRRHG